jgi:predicted metal-dependent phosphoesterase TrpH
MLLDLHCHSRYSYDNQLDPRDPVARAYELGLDGVCFTEHHSFNASFPVTKMKLPPDFLVFRGVEVSTDDGHLPVYGVSNDTWNRWGREHNLNLSLLLIVLIFLPNREDFGKPIRRFRRQTQIILWFTPADC